MSRPTCSSLSRSRIRLDSRLLCLSYSIAAYEYTRRSTYTAILWKYDIVHKIGSTQYKLTATPPKEYQARATGIMHKKSVKFGRVVFVLCEQTDGQTNRQTNRHTHHSTSWAEVILTVVVIAYKRKSLHGYFAKVFLFLFFLLLGLCFSDFNNLGL